MRIENLENSVRHYAQSLDNFHVLEYERDASVSPANAAAILCAAAALMSTRIRTR